MGGGGAGSGHSTRSDSGLSGRNIRNKLAVVAGGLRNRSVGHSREGSGGDRGRGVDEGRDVGIVITCTERNIVVSKMLLMLYTTVIK